MYVLATAGHVDHGKSTLVRALTGMEPDRWAEERRRGMTIDLGYAWTTLPDGQELAFVDVPGHERFIANMLAGLGPAPGVLFVVAADEGWSRQSEEHLAAVDALDLRHGVLAITRSDLADPSSARKQSLARIGRSSLGAVRAVAVSGATGTGLTELRAALADLVGALPPPDPRQRIRLWIDRAFTVRGSGTVVTGTLAAGTIHVGDELLLHERPVPVRAVQSLGRSRPSIAATARVALNLRGVSVEDVGRGDVLLSPGHWHRTTELDVRLDRADDLPPGLILHVGTAAVPIHLRPLAPNIARLRLPRSLPLLAGDRGVLRDPSRHAVAAGVLVLDADPPPLRRRGAARARAAQLARGRPSAKEELARRGAVRRDHLLALGIIPDPTAREVAGWVIATETWDQWVAAVPAQRAEWAARNPLQPALPLSVLSRRLSLPDPALLAPVVADAGVTPENGRLPAPHSALGAAEVAVRAVEQRLHAAPFDAPDRDELAALRLGRRELAAAARAGRLLILGDDVAVLPDAPERAAAALRTLPQPFTLSQGRQALATSRRVAVPLLEHLDRIGRTERLDSSLRRVVD